MPNAPRVLHLAEALWSFTSPYFVFVRGTYASQFVRTHFLIPTLLRRDVIFHSLEAN